MEIALIRSSSMLFTVPIAGITRGEGQIALRVPLPVVTVNGRYLVKIVFFVY